MKKIILLFSTVIFFGFATKAQIAINSSGNSPDGSAMLDVTSSSKGVLIPRMTSSNRLSISNPAKALLVYDSTQSLFFFNIGSAASPLWQSLSHGSLWSSSGYTMYTTNATDSVGIGTSGPVAKLDVRGNTNVSGEIQLYQNTFITSTAFNYNTFIGYANNGSNTGTGNTLLGYLAGRFNTTGYNNTCLGTYAGFYNLTGDGNVFVGDSAGLNITSGNTNVMIGNKAGPFSNTDHKLYIHNAPGTPLIYGDFGNLYVGLNTETPGTNFAIYENNTNLNPAALIEQGGSGDAAQRFLLTGGQNFSIGIDNNDNDNFRISSTVNLGSTTPAYNETALMMRIHSENTQPGIIDFNHQSRARVFLDQDGPGQSIPPAAWTGILFDLVTYDEHGEWFINPSISSKFTALEEGYYQVNSRTEFASDDLPSAGYCSIAIYKNGLMYAQGNNLNLQSWAGMEPTNNNAPNVSDVVYLQAGDTIEIYVWQSTIGPLPLRTGESQTYCSVHKVS